MKKILLLLVALLSVFTLGSCHKTVEKFTVSFDSNGGSPIPSQEIEKGETATRPADPTKDGWDFQNWYSDETLKTIYTFQEKVEGDITLYAKWEEKHVELQTIINDVNLNNNFVLFNAAKKEKENKQTEFFDREQHYLVGIDNPFNVKPEVSFLKYNPATGDIFPTTVDKWEYDVDVFVKRADDQYECVTDSKDLTTEYIDAIDNVNCTVDFTKAAVGETFKVEVVPTGLTEKQQQTVKSYTMSFEFDVTEGYNVYSTKELAYIDNRVKNTGGTSWNEFKKANNLDINYNPSKIIMHTNLKLNAADLPAAFFFQENEVSKTDPDYDRYEEIKNEDGTVTKKYIGVVGSMKDHVDIFNRTLAAKEEFGIEGNYFTLDFSGIREVIRENNKPTNKGELFSHSQIFRIDGSEDSKFSLRNLNIIGNAPKEENSLKAGGAILIKVTNPQASIYNNISKCNFITYFPEKKLTNMTVEKCKGYDAYNCFIYNWGSNIDIKDSEFIGAGGPIIIQDHAYHDEADGGMTPTTNIANSKLESYVAGTEGWFVMVGAAPIIGTIKALDNLLNPFGRSFLKKSSKDQLITFMNFICLNKSGSAQGMTAVKVDGNLTIDTNKFNYGKENPYLAAMIEQTREKAAPTICSSAAEGADGFGYFNGSDLAIIDVTGKPNQNPQSKLYQGDYLTLYYTGMMIVLGYYPAGQIR